jgi:hypothetical protein
MSTEPKQPQRVPTLTEVIIDLPADQAAATPAAPARGDAQVAPETLMAEALMQETRIVSKVIERLQPRIDVLFEHRLREALAPTVARIYAALADEMRKELARKLREAVERPHLRAGDRLRMGGASRAARTASVSPRHPRAWRIDLQRAKPCCSVLG